MFLCRFFILSFSWLTAIESPGPGWTRGVILREELSSGNSEPRHKPADSEAELGGGLGRWQKTLPESSMGPTQLTIASNWFPWWNYGLIWLNTSLLCYHGKNSVTYKIILKSQCLSYSHRRPQCYSGWCPIHLYNPRGDFSSGLEIRG